MKATAIISLLMFGAVAGTAQTLTSALQFVASGTVGAQSFTNANITIRTVGSKEDGYSSEYFDYIYNTSASIVISGVGTYQFLANTETGVGIVGLPIRQDTYYGTVAFTVGSATISAYGIIGLWVMGSSVGPLSLVGSVQNWNVSPVITADGYTLILNDSGMPLTFQAILGVSCAGTPGANVTAIQAVINESFGVTLPVTDMNGDGVVNVVDVQSVIDAALGCGTTTIGITPAGFGKGLTILALKRRL